MATYTITLLPSALVSWGGDQAFDLNNEGIAVGSVGIIGPLAGELAPGRGAVRWNPNATLLAPFAPIDELSSAYGINSVGHVVGGTGKSIPEGQAFLYKSGVMHNLASVLNTVSNLEQSKAHDINDAGVIVGYAGRINRLHAFRYDSETPTPPVDLGALPGHNQSFAHAINGKGQVTGISQKESSPHDRRAFLYDHGLIDLGPADFANDINDAGQVVGARVIDGTSHLPAPYVCDTSSRPPQFTDLGSLALLGFVSGIAWGINTRGDIVGDSFTEVGVGVVQMSRAWVRPAGGRMQDLNSLIPPSSGWLLGTAQAINDEGLIVGTGAYLGGSRAYLLTPAPEPSGFSWPWPLNVIIDRLGNIFGGGT